MCCLDIFYPNPPGPGGEDEADTDEVSTEIVHTPRVQRKEGEYNSEDAVPLRMIRMVEKGRYWC